MLLIILCKLVLKHSRAWLQKEASCLFYLFPWKPLTVLTPDGWGERTLKSTAATAKEFQHRNRPRQLSEIKRWLKSPVFPVHTLREAHLREGRFLHGPLNSPLLHRSENYMIINHSLALLESKQYPSQCEDIWSSLFLTCCGFRGTFRCFYCRKGLRTACINRPHTDTFIDDQRGILADLFSAERRKKLPPRRFYLKWLLVCHFNTLNA